MQSALNARLKQFFCLIENPKNLIKLSVFILLGCNFFNQYFLF